MLQSSPLFKIPSQMTGGKGKGGSGVYTVCREILGVGAWSNSKPFAKPAVARKWLALRIVKRC